MTALHYCHISPNMACFCKLLAQNWHKNLPLCGRVVVFSCGQYYSILFTFSSGQSISSGFLTASFLAMSVVESRKKGISQNISQSKLLFSFIIYNCNSMHMSKIWQVVTNSIMLSYSIIPNSYRVIFPVESNLKFRFSHMFK